jgi:hypothetical protein
MLILVWACGDVKNQNLAAVFVIAGALTDLSQGVEDGVI